MKISFKNPKSGELKDVKVGWSWTLCLFSGLFGLPLFLRKLNTWGFVLLALWIVNFILPAIAGDDAAGLQFGMFAIFLGLEIWLGVKGNEITAKNYLEMGWVFADPLSENTRFAQGKWGITVDGRIPVSTQGAVAP